MKGADNMKLIKRLRRKKGFTLTECLVAIVIFALMSAIVMQILAIAINQYKNNDKVDKDMDAQINNLVQENALVERDTTNLVMKFVSGSGGTNEVKINDIKIQQDNSGTSGDSRLEINKLNANITSNPGSSDKDKNTGGMITEDIHIYGTKDIDTIYVEEKSCTLADGRYTIVLDFEVSTSKSVLNGSECRSLKVALPNNSSNIVVTPDAKMLYSMVSSTNVRFYAKNVSNTDTSYTMHISFSLPEDEFDSSYGSFAKYFIKPDSESTDKSCTFDDQETNGIYTHVHTV